MKIRTRTQKKTGDLLVEVVNHGIGFRNIESSELFEVGYRGQDAREKIASGSGLGLYICKRIVENEHQGTIEAEHSSSNGETVFRIRFPQWSIQ